MAAGKKVEVFDSKDDLAGHLAKYTADLSEKFTKERGSFTVVLSGGSLIDYLRLGICFRHIFIELVLILIVPSLS